MLGASLLGGCDLRADGEGPSAPLGISPLTAPPKSCLYDGSLKFRQVPRREQRGQGGVHLGVQDARRNLPRHIEHLSFCSGVSHASTSWLGTGWEGKQLPVATVTKVSQIGGLTTANIYTSPFWEGRQKPEIMSAGPYPAGGLGGRCFLAALVSDGCWADLGLHGHPVSVFLSVRSSPFLIMTQVILD